jgi:transposase-like protein
VTIAAPEPLGGLDYPRTLGDFNAFFPNERACLDYLARLRWPGGFLCPVCGGTRAWRMSKGRNLRCAACRTDVSVTAGTIFADTRLPLASWFAAAWYASSQKPGVSALGLKRVLGLGSYETAWALLHKLRRAMVRPGRELLGEELEADESYLGGPRTGKRGRGALGKQIVAVAAEVLPRAAIGRIRVARIPDCSEETLTAFVSAVAAPGSVVYTDHWSGYSGLSAAGFRHWPTNISASGDPAHVTMPRVHRVASLLKRWLLGTHQGGVKPGQLDRYLEEFVFRFNRRTSRHRGLVFYRLLQQAVQVEPVPFSRLIAPRS